jgi:site-specific DNA-cytosine methylase
MNAQEKTVAEFFAGIGLMRIGLENAGWRIAFANDIDHDKSMAEFRTDRIAGCQTQKARRHHN